MVNFRDIHCFLYVFIYITLASCLQIADKKCLAMSRKLEFDNYALIEKNFRIQEINGILRPECVHQCLRNGTKCVGVLVNEIFQSCWLLKCSMNLRLLQKGFLQLSNGWNYYANGDGKNMKIKFETKETVLFIMFIEFIRSTCICLYVLYLLFS